MTTAKSDNSKRPKRKAPWRGKRRVPDPKDKRINFRCAAADYAKIDKAAADEGLTIGAWMRKTAVGAAGARARRRPTVATRQLAQILGHIGHIGGNINQIAHRFNASEMPPAPAEIRAMNDNIQQLSKAVMRAIRRGH